MKIANSHLFKRWKTSPRNLFIQRVSLSFPILHELFVTTVVNDVDFLSLFPYTNGEKIGGMVMNEFEKNVQCTRNDAVDSAVGFIVSFGFFATMFIIATLVKFFGA
ncbi:hypothetical protein F510_2325 [Anoxybacillus gonensis]|nr:hypothetical protein F510_2325 [Anoxybacillus gonensis]